MKRETMKKGLGILLQTFPNKEISPEIAWPMLSDLTDQEFEKAIIEIISTRVEMFPNTNMIALIREIAKVDKCSALAGEAWGEVLCEISRTGRYGSPKFSDPTIALAVNCIGWKTLCDSESIGVERAHFLKIYETLDKRNKEDAVRITNNQVIGMITDLSKKMAIK